MAARRRASVRICWARSQAMRALRCRARSASRAMRCSSSSDTHQHRAGGVRCGGVALLGVTFEELAEIRNAVRAQQPVRGFVVTPYGYEVIKDVAMEEELQAMLRGVERRYGYEPLVGALLSIPVRISAQYPPQLGDGEVFLDVGSAEPDGC